MELNAKRIALTEAVVAEWRGQNIDVVIAPGMAMPAVKLGYPGWLITAITYTYVYNLLNFPAGSVPVIFFYFFYFYSRLFVWGG